MPPSNLSGTCDVTLDLASVISVKKGLRTQAVRIKLAHQLEDTSSITRMQSSLVHWVAANQFCQFKTSLDTTSCLLVPLASNRDNKCIVENPREIKFGRGDGETWELKNN
ncbi:hypothetical protein J6590_085603 [Homalodisca vitripennis]|nr:hypothetical protein J6590_085603 [Homalodisca vitripennis]